MDNNYITTKMQEADETNSRYVLELERNELLKQQEEFDAKYGRFSFSFLTSFELLAVLSYLTIIIILLRRQHVKTRTNFIVIMWAFLNLLALSEKIIHQISTITGVFYWSKHFIVVGEMLNALSRTYGTLLYIVWFFNRYCQRPNLKYNWLLNTLMFLPLLICTFFVYIYFYIDEFVYEVYTPGSDIINLALYFVVTILFIFSQIFNEETYSHSHYVLLISIVNFVSNFPICLAMIYIRFVLDISWIYRFHIYFVDFILDIIACSNAFIALFMLFILNNNKNKDNKSLYYT